MVPQGFLANLEIKSSLVDQIKDGQEHCIEVAEIKKNIGTERGKCFSIDDQGVVYFGNRLVVPNDPDLKELILKEAHDSPLSIHPRSTKMYRDLHQLFWPSKTQRKQRKPKENSVKTEK